MVRDLRRRTVSRRVLCGGMFVAMLASTVAAQEPRRVRTSGAPLVELVKPNESTLIVESRRSPPLEVLPPAGTSALDWMFQISEVVLVVSVDDTRSQITASEDWITSTVQASVIEVLKAPGRLSLKASDQVSFEEDGGEAVVGGVLITAVVPWAKHVATGTRYLLFAGVNKKTGALVVDPAGLYEIPEGSGKLQRLARVQGPNDIEQESADDVLTRARQLGDGVR